MKILLTCIIFVCCLFIGIVIKIYFLKREKFYLNLIIFLENILNKISFNNEKLNNIIKEINNETYCKDFDFFIEYYLKLINNKITKEKFKNLIKNKFNYLNDFEIKRFFNVVFNIGLQTKEEEVVELKKYIQEFSVCKNESQNLNKKYSNLYLKLFIFLGLMFFIVFI